MYDDSPLSGALSEDGDDMEAEDSEGEMPEEFEVAALDFLDSELDDDTRIQALYDAIRACKGM